MKCNFVFFGASVFFLSAPFSTLRAAELPSGRADRAAQARSCDSYGKGFAYNAATESCIRVSGSVATEYSYRSSSPFGLK